MPAIVSFRSQRFIMSSSEDEEGGKATQLPATSTPYRDAPRTTSVQPLRHSPSATKGRRLPAVPDSPANGGMRVLKEHAGK